MNRFVNNFMASLSEEEKEVPFLTNQARALWAYMYSEGSVQRTGNHGKALARRPSSVMALTQLDAVFPHNPFTSLEQLFRECGENINTVLDHLTTKANGQAQPKASTCTMTMDDCENLRRLLVLFPQLSNMLQEYFSSFSFDFGKTEDFLVSLTSSSSTLSSSPSPSSCVSNFCDVEDCLPSTSGPPDLLSTSLSLPEGQTSGTEKAIEMPSLWVHLKSSQLPFLPALWAPTGW